MSAPQSTVDVSNAKQDVPVHENCTYAKCEGKGKVHRQEGRMEGNMVGRKKGRKEARNEGGKEGRRKGRKEDR